MIQILILIISGCAIYCVSYENVKIRILGGLFGIIVQPIWLYDTYFHDQWGIFILSFIMFISYFRIFINNLKLYRMIDVNS